jgi:hypothetical protein
VNLCRSPKTNPPTTIGKPVERMSDTAIATPSLSRSAPFLQEQEIDLAHRIVRSRPLGATQERFSQGRPAGARR